MTGWEAKHKLFYTLIAIDTLIPIWDLAIVGFVGLAGHLLFTVITATIAVLQGRSSRWAPLIVIGYYLLLVASYAILYVPFMIVTAMIVGDFTGANSWLLFVCYGSYLYGPALFWYYLVGTSLSRSISGR